MVNSLLSILYSSLFFQVLMGFMLDSAPASELPLIIDFEAKSIAKQFPDAVARMNQRGYVVSNFAQDGFALLRGDRMFGGGSGGKLKKKQQ